MKQYDARIVTVPRAQAMKEALTHCIDTGHNTEACREALSWVEIKLDQLKTEGKLRDRDEKIKAAERRHNRQQVLKRRAVTLVVQARTWGFNSQELQQMIANAYTYGTMR